VKKPALDLKIVPINWIDDAERWVLVPAHAGRSGRRRTKEIRYVKDRCYFSYDVPKSIIDFTYRAVRKLNLGERTLIFSRGTVRSARGIVKNAVSIRELAWGVGTLVTIPRVLKYGEHVQISFDGAPERFRLMELVLLHGLLRIAFPGKKPSFYRETSSRILVQGWRALDSAKSSRR
jgi:hypothetical protein